MVEDSTIFDLAPTPEAQLRKLAEFILENFPDEVDGRLGVDIAIAIMENLELRLDGLDK